MEVGCQNSSLCALAISYNAPGAWDMRIKLVWNRKKKKDDYHSIIVINYTYHGNALPLRTTNFTHTHTHLPYEVSVIKILQLHAVT